MSDAERATADGPERERATGSAASAWASPAVSWSLLTILPAPPVAASRAALTLASAWFPAIGLLLGALLGALGLLLDRLLPSGPVAALLLLAGALLTGGLHLDGLMDTADGLAGGRTPARRLEIMRDSRVGAFGALAAALLLLAQYACLAELRGPARLVALVVALSMSRWAMTLALALFPAARADGLGAAVRPPRPWLPLSIGALLAGGIALLTGPLGLAGLLAATGATLLGGWLLVRRLGGLTGDTYGALAVATETLVLYLAVGGWTP